MDAVNLSDGALTDVTMPPFLDHPEPEFTPRRARGGIMADARLAGAAGISQPIAL